MSSWELAQTLVSTLVAQQIREVVLAPGSRSAALAVALAKAEQAGQLRLHIRIDERVAGFLALGLAKASGTVVPVVCTSGTAVGNLLPAAMEARYAGIGWLALTCDRPAYQVGTGSSQTADQVGLLGKVAVADLRLSSVSGHSAVWAGGLRRALAAAAGIRTRRPGPVQLNLEFEDQVLPGPESIPQDWELSASAQVEVCHSQRGSAIELAAGPRTVIVAGDASPAVGAEARALAEVANVPLFAEPSSNARNGSNAITTYRLLLGGSLGQQIERVVTFGHPTLSRPLLALLSNPEVEHVVVSSGADWFDIGATAHLVTDAVLLNPHSADWLTAWQTADKALQTQLQQQNKTMSGYSLAAAVVQAVPAGNNLVFGASNPIRDADLAPLGPGAITWANRGLAGIDGLISTAVGIGLATGSPTTLFIGDLSFLHDVGGLTMALDQYCPELRIVVADDNGGAIFHTLEQGDKAYQDIFERVFATPQDQDLVAIASSFGWSATRFTALDQLRAALAQPVKNREVFVAQIDRFNRRLIETQWRGLVT